MPILEVNHLVKTFPVRGSGFKRHKLIAVNDVTLKIEKGKTLGLVGESGCGKSTLGRTILRLIEPSEGSILFDGKDVASLSSRELKKLRQRMQIIFQDPYSSLNPRMTVADILSEPFLIHGIHKSRTSAIQGVKELLSLVGLPEESLYRYPHEFSGGQRQRIGIARALAVKPELVVCDEPVSALDVSIQAQIVNLLMDLQKKLGLTYLFISHDLRVVNHISDEVAVMYLGKVVEWGPKEVIFNNPKHPYTVSLLSAIPKLDDGVKTERVKLQGEPPTPLNPPSGCTFHPRCPKAIDQCKVKVPVLRKLAEKDTRLVSCDVVE